MKKQSKPMSQQEYEKKDYTKIDNDIEYQQKLMEKLLNQTYAPIEEKEKKFEKVVEGSDIWQPLLYLIATLFNSILAFKLFLGSTYWSAIGFLGIIMNSIIFFCFVIIFWISIDTRKVYWREIK